MHLKEKLHIGPALLEQYILGLTTDDESQQIEQFLAQNPSMAQDIEEGQKAIEAMAMEYALQPPAELRQRVMKAVKEPPTPMPSIKPQIPSYSWITGVAAVFAIGLGLLTFVLYQQQVQMEAQIASLGREIQQLQQQNTQLVSQKNTINQQFTVLKDVNTAHVHLTGSQLSPKALIVVYWNETDEHALLNIVSLPDIPTDKSLQLWADVEGEMIDMGILENNNSQLISIPFIPNAEAFNLTLEPKGGNTRPTVDKIFANGKLL